MVLQRITAPTAATTAAAAADQLAGMRFTILRTFPANSVKVELLGQKEGKDKTVNTIKEQKSTSATFATFL